MSTANPGKKFETDFKNSVPDNVFCHRLKTRNTTYKGDNEIADFLLYKAPNLFVFELKTTKEKRLPFDMIRANQIIGIDEATTKYVGVYGGIIVQFREPYSHWYVPIEVIKEQIEAGAKSIPLAKFSQIDGIISIPFTQKRVSVKLDISMLLYEAHMTQNRRIKNGNNITSSISD